jgi:hypothetical protein
MKYNTTEYSIKVCLTSFFVWPLVFLLIFWLRYHETDFEVFFLAIPLGVLVSLSSFPVLYLTCKYITKMFRNVVVIKILVTVVDLSLTYISFFIINNYIFQLNDLPVSQVFFPSYCIAMAFGIWFYRRRLIEPTSLEENIIP